MEICQGNQCLPDPVLALVDAVTELPHARRLASTDAAPLVALELDHPTLDLGGLHVLFPPDRRPPAKGRAMIDHLIEAFAQLPRHRATSARS